MNPQVQYILDREGNPAYVVLDAAEYERMRAALEERADLRAYDEAKASGEIPIAFQQAVAEFEQAVIEFAKGQ